MVIVEVFVYSWSFISLTRPVFFSSLLLSRMDAFFVDFKMDVDLGWVLLVVPSILSAYPTHVLPAFCCLARCSQNQNPWATITTLTTMPDLIHATF